MTTPFDEQRLHPLSWLFIAGIWLKGLIAPVILVALVSGGGSGLWSSYEIWALPFILPAFALAFVKYWLYTYRFAPGELIVRDGFLTRNERHIPYARIQTIDIVQNPLHRLSGVALVRLQTASGAKPEAVLRVLSLEAIEQMRERVFRGRPARVAAPDAAAAPVGAVSVAGQPRGADSSDRDPAAAASAAEALVEDPRVLLRLSTADLVKLGLISNRGFVVVAAVMGLAWQLDWWSYPGWESLGWDPAEWSSATRQLFAERGEALGAWGRWLTSRDRLQLGALLAAAGLLAFVVLMRFFSIGWHLITLHGFALRRLGDDLRVEYGLFNRISATIPTPRIQLLSTYQSPLHRLFGKTSVSIETAGGVGGEEDLDWDAGPKTGREWLAPLVDAERVAGLLRDVLPELGDEPVRWRIFKASIAMLVALTAVAAFFLGAWSVLLLAFGLPLALVNARMYVRHTAYALSPRAVLFRSGWLSRRMSVVRFDKAQTVALQQSPFDRRHAMGSVYVDTAGGGRVGHTVDIPYLEMPVAEWLRDRVYLEASGTMYRW
jgi:putative membrane protein